MADKKHSGKDCQTYGGQARQQTADKPWAEIGELVTFLRMSPKAPVKTGEVS